MTDLEGARLAAVRPTPRQLRWQAHEFYGFVTVGMNTMTGREWGTGTEDPALWNPAHLDARQWVAALASAGMTGVILTAKHHDGFCLWPTATTAHSVASSPWRGGRGDVVAELAEAAQAAGMSLGVYLSPWDLNAPSYGAGRAYDDFFVAQLTELVTGYGPLFSVWFDGACGEGPNGRVQVYDWDRYYAVVREHQPEAAISVCGPDVRWCGNEAGHARDQEWSVVPRALQRVELIAERSQSVAGDEFARLVRSDDADLGSRAALAGVPDLVWYPAEVDTSIRPGWFYHASEDDAVRSVDELLEIYSGAVDGNACLLLNAPPDTDGLIAAPDVATLAELGRRLQARNERLVAGRLEYSSGGLGGDELRRASAQAWGVSGVVDASLGLANGTGWWQPEASDAAPWLRIELDRSHTITGVLLKEEISLGQRLEQVVVRVNGVVVAEAQCVGYQRRLSFDPVEADAVVLEFPQFRDTPAIAGVRIQT